MAILDEIKRMRQIMSIINEEKTNISISCPKCDHGWTIDSEDKDPYLCHQCGYDKLSGEYEFDKLAKWEMENGINENDDEDDYNPEDDYLFDTRGDLIELKKELINSGVNNNTRLHLTHESDLEKKDFNTRADFLADPIQLAKDFDGICHLRLDDTNPEKESDEYVEAIKKDIQWLGFQWNDKLFHASDYFDSLYQCAIDLIEAGKAYVCIQKLGDLIFIFVLQH